MNSIDQDKAIELLRKEMKYALSRIQYLERQVQALKDAHDSSLSPKVGMRPGGQWPE